MKKQLSVPDDMAPLEEARTSDQRQLVLVVEDDDALRRILTIALEDQGYSVVTAASIQEADLALQQWADAGLGLVISDINLTRGNLTQEGYALYQRWSRRYPSLPYMLISADPTNRCLPAIRDGHVRFVQKPFQLGTLIDHSRELLGHTLFGDAFGRVPGAALSRFSFEAI